jgi:anti-sigma B factor antagonist
MTPTETPERNEKQRATRVPFEIGVDENVRPPVLALKGDVDIAVAERLHERLSQLLEAGYSQLVIDCEGITYVDSTGLSELVWAVNRMPENGKVKLVGCSARLVKLLQVTGLNTVFELVQPGAA